MKSNELRIGNLVVFSDEARIFEITEIYNTGITVIDNEKDENTWIELECFEPIPLTEEWLLKFGFEKIGLNYELKGFIVWVNINGYFTYRNGIYETILKNLHQLQNLYFALTNQELTIKQ